MTRPPTPSRRSGFSLLEVVVAFGIFVLAFAGISQLLNISSNSVLETRYANRAAQLLQTQMNRVTSGEIALNTSQGDSPFDEDQDWSWSINTANDGNLTNLWTVTITVSRSRGNGSNYTASLTQMILDPNAKGTLDSSSSSSSSSGTTGAKQGN